MPGLTPEQAVDRLDELHTAGLRRPARGAGAFHRHAACRRRPRSAPPSAIPSCASTGSRPARCRFTWRVWAKFQSPGRLRDHGDAAGLLPRLPARAAAPAGRRVRREPRGRPRAAQEIPYPYVLERRRRVRPCATSRPPSSPAISRRRCSPMSATRSPTAPGIFEAGEPRPLALFDAVRVDYSLRRLVHYTGTDWRTSSPGSCSPTTTAMSTSSSRWALERARRRTAPYERLVLPGGVDDRARRRRRRRPRRVIAAAPWHRFQMPAYHLLRARRRRRRHPRQHRRRPVQRQDHHRPSGGAAPALLADGRPLRRPAPVADDRRLRAGARLSAAGPHPRRRWCRPTCRSRRWPRCRSRCRRRPPRSPASSGEALKRRLRTGTVVTYDDRNWELRWSPGAAPHQPVARHRRRHGERHGRGPGLPPARALRHAALRLRQAAARRDQAAGRRQRLLRARGRRASADRPRGARPAARASCDTLHSRKLRSFDEPPFR